MDLAELSGTRCQLLKFCRQCGRAAKLFCSSAHGTAVNLPQHKSNSSFLSTGNLIFSCFHLSTPNAFCEPLGRSVLVLRLVSGRQGWCE